MELDILFLGRLFPREKESEIKSKMKTGMQDAANALQWNIIDGLESNCCGKLKILNYLPIDSYPKGYQDKKIEEFVFQHTDRYRADDINVGCTNRSVIKQIVNIFPFEKKVKLWARQKTDKKKVLLLYTPIRMFLSLAKLAKKVNPEVEVCCVIADIPQFAMVQDLRGIRKLYNIYTVRRCNSLYKYVDKFVLLTEQMADKLNIRSPFIVVEGIAAEPSDTDGIVVGSEYETAKYALYSGTLNYKFGINELLKAFSLISDKNLKLLICGFGQAESAIREIETQDKRVRFLGRVDRKVALELQRKATVLVNPRQNNEEFTKYSFPSKTMEYLAAGVPVVAYKLDGIPDEYDEYINYVPDDSPEALAEVIENICRLSDDERKQMGERGKRFVLENKNYRVQTKRILEFIEEKINVTV